MANRSFQDRFMLQPSGDVIPPSVDVVLSYCDATLTRNNVGSAYLTFNMRLNNAYDPDPLLLSGGMSGFNEYAKFYSFYRVLNTEIEWNVCNNETFPVYCGYFASGAPLSVSSVATAADALENPYSMGPYSLSPKGGMDRVNSRRSYVLSNVWGDKLNYLADDSFASSVSSGPTYIIVATFVAYAPSNFVAGISSNLRLRMRIRFYGRYTLEG
jgi:hypothetical protein